MFGGLDLTKFCFGTSFSPVGPGLAISHSACLHQSRWTGVRGARDWSLRQGGAPSQEFPVWGLQVDWSERGRGLESPVWGLQADWRRARLSQLPALQLCYRSSDKIHWASVEATWGSPPQSGEGSPRSGLGVPTARDSSCFSLSTW